MKNKGFTLIELIGVIIIMGLLIMIVFPATVKLMKDNDTKKYGYYYDLVVEAAELYANKRKDDLGGVEGTGCIDDVTLSDLIKEDLIKKFEDEEITCGSPSEFVNIEDLGIIASDYVDVRIKNNKGNISSEVSLVCVKGRKLVYSNLVEKTGTCSKYVAVAKNTLVEQVAKIAKTTDDNVNYFVAGNTTNNYVWYSGKLWRIIGYNKTDKTVKLITDEVVSMVSYDVAYSNYSESNISYWLNSEFIKSLKNPDVYLVDSKWNFTTVTNTNKPANTNLTTSKVGLINAYEYNKIKGFLNIGQNWWLLSRYSNTNAWYVNSSNAATNNTVANFYGVRPSIVLKANISYMTGSEGTKENPYRLAGDNSANPGTNLNTRYAGEYVNFSGNKYRIVSTNKDYTRLILMNNLSVGNIQYHYQDDNYSAMTTIGAFLNTNWYQELSEEEKAKLFTADFCTTKILPTISQTKACPNSDVINVTVGLPKLGDMFTTANSSGEYWTLSPADRLEEKKPRVNVVTPNGIISQKYIEEVSGIRPVINISSNVTIKGGAGTNESPYILN